MKHTEVYGLRTRGTKADVKGALAAMEEGGVDGHEIMSTPMETPPPDEVISLHTENGGGASEGWAGRSNVKPLIVST